MQLMYIHLTAFLFRKDVSQFMVKQMTPLEKQERKKKENNKRIKKKIDPFWDKKKNDDKLWYSDFLFWEN